MELDSYTGFWQLLQAKNSYKPDALLKSKAPASERARLRTSLDDKHGGNPGGLLDTQGGKIVMSAQTNTEADWINTRRQIGEMIAGVMGYPVWLLTNSANTESNVKLGEVQLQQHALRLMLRFASSLESILLTEEEIDAGWRISPDISGVEALQANVAEQAATAKILTEAGWTPQQAAAVVGLEEPEIEEPKKPDEPPPGAEEEDEETDIEEEETKDE
jgi:hypothetical protein